MRERLDLLRSIAGGELGRISLREFAELTKVKFGTLRRAYYEGEMSRDTAVEMERWMRERRIGGDADWLLDGSGRPPNTSLQTPGAEIAPSVWYMLADALGRLVEKSVLREELHSYEGARMIAAQLDRISRRFHRYGYIEAARDFAQEAASIRKAWRIPDPTSFR